jgi:hypothetical protein
LRKPRDCFAPGGRWFRSIQSTADQPSSRRTVATASPQIRRSDYLVLEQIEYVLAWLGGGRTPRRSTRSHPQGGFAATSNMHPSEARMRIVFSLIPPLIFMPLLCRRKPPVAHGDQAPCHRRLQAECHQSIR